MADLASRNYIKYSPDILQKPQNEDEDIQAVAEMINNIQRAQYNVHRHCYGGTHARTHAVVKGSFEVLEDLPKHLRQGEIFHKPGSVYPVIARYSTEPGDPGLDDRIPQPRGFAMKLFNVDGDFFDDGKEFHTQDIEFNSTPALDLADAKTTKEIIGLRIQYGDKPEELQNHLKQRSDCPLQTARDKVYNTHLEAINQYSQTAYRFGEYVMKYRLIPSSEPQRKAHEEEVKSEHGSDIFHRWLQSFYGAHPAEYDFQIQLLENLEDQPVEYAGKVWDPEKYPFQTVAKVRFPKQDSFDYARKAFWEDRMRIDPFLGLKSYEPIGSPNRLRRAVYPASSALRRKMNGTTVIHVKSIDEIP